MLNNIDLKNSTSDGMKTIEYEEKNDVKRPTTLLLNCFVFDYSSSDVMSFCVLNLFIWRHFFFFEGEALKIYCPLFLEHFVYTQGSNWLIIRLLEANMNTPVVPTHCSVVYTSLNFVPVEEICILFKCLCIHLPARYL